MNLVPQIQSINLRFIKNTRTKIKQFEVLKLSKLNFFFRNIHPYIRLRPQH